MLCNLVRGWSNARHLVIILKVFIVWETLPLLNKSIWSICICRKENIIVKLGHISIWFFFETFKLQKRETYMINTLFLTMVNDYFFCYLWKKTCHTRQVMYSLTWKVRSGKWWKNAPMQYNNTLMLYIPCPICIYIDSPIIRNNSLHSHLN